MTDSCAFGDARRWAGPIARDCAEIARAGWPRRGQAVSVEPRDEAPAPGRTRADGPRRRTLERGPPRGVESRHEAAPMQPEALEGREAPHVRDLATKPQVRNGGPACSRRPLGPLT